MSFLRLRTSKSFQEDCQEFTLQSVPVRDVLFLHLLEGSDTSRG